MEMLSTIVLHVGQNGHSWKANVSLKQKITRKVQEENWTLDEEDCVVFVDRRD